MRIDIKKSSSPKRSTAARRSAASTDSPSAAAHKAAAPAAVGVVVLVVSTRTSRGESEDRSGGLIRDLLLAAGHRVPAFRIVPDEAEAIRGALREFGALPEVAAVITTGGTGLTATDVTVETVKPLFKRELTAFAPLFLQLSFAEVGSACLASRATAGVLEGGRLCFALPGSPNACRLALEKLIIPELPHLVKHLRES